MIAAVRQQRGRAFWREALKGTSAMRAISIEMRDQRALPIVFFANVERWHDDALAAGWTDSQWTRLSCIMQRESGGIPTAKNPRSSAMGLLQIMWSAHSRWIGGSSSQLYDGPTNLRLGRQLFDRAGGWSPWISTSSRC